MKNDPKKMIKQAELKEYLIELLYGQSTNMDAYPLIDAAHNSKVTIHCNKPTKEIKEVTLGQETVPRVGHLDIISNDFWDLQDNGLKQLFPELTDSIENFEFLIIIIDDVKFNKKTEKVEVTQKRQKFWFKNENRQKS